MTYRQAGSHAWRYIIYHFGFSFWAAAFLLFLTCHAHAQVDTATGTQRDVAFRMMAGQAVESLEQAVKEVEASDAAKKSRYGSLSAQMAFRRAAQATTPNKHIVDTFGLALSELAIEGRPVYRLLLQEPAIKAWLIRSELDYGGRVFATEASNAQARAIFNDINALVAAGLFPEEPVSGEPSEDAWPAMPKRGIADHRALLAALADVRAMLAQDSALGVPASYSTTYMYAVITYLRDKVISAKRAERALLVERVMRYLSPGNLGRAYWLFLRESTAEQPDNALAVKLGKIFLAQYCSVPETAHLMCLNVLSQIGINDRQLDGRARLTNRAAILKKMLGQHPTLVMGLSAARARPAGSEADRAKAMSELSMVMPRVERLLDSQNVEESMIRLSEAHAVSYWMVKAANDKSTEFLTRLSESPGGGDELPIIVLSMAHRHAVALGDMDTALHITDDLKRLVAVLMKHRPSGKRAQVDAHLDAMKLATLYVAGKYRQGRHLATQIQDRIRPLLQRSSGKTVHPVLLSDCAHARTAEPDFMESDGDPLLARVYYAAVQTQLELDVRTGTPVPPSLVRSLLEFDARQLLRPPPLQSNGFRSEDREDTQERRFSAAEFIADWVSNSRALRRNPGQLKALAVSVKCLLSRPELLSSLGAEIVNKDPAERVRLSDAIYTLLYDSGTFENNEIAIDEADFGLLQSASILQAHSGITAATARSVFPTEQVRERVRVAEASMSKLMGRLTAANMFNEFSRAGGMDGSGPQGLLEVAEQYPQQYALYVTLKNQSIASLKDTEAALKPDQAAILFTVAGGKVLAMVMRHSGTTAIPITVPRTALLNRTEQLLVSLRFPASQDGPFPPPYRADLAWSLYVQLFRPLEAHLAGVSTVFLVAGDELARLPFPALVTARPPAQSQVDFSTYRGLSWLGDRYAFVSLPSIHSLRKISSVAGPSDDLKLLVVSEPAVDSAVLAELGLETIPEAAPLIARTRRIGDPVPLLKQRASYSELVAVTKEGALRATDIALINSHGLPPLHSEKYGTREPAILLAPDKDHGQPGAGFLDPSKIMELRMGVRLMMLLACETAGGRTADNAQPFAGLVNAFFFAGADTVLATHLPVDATVTEEIAAAFLKHVRSSGISSAKALQLATSEIRCASGAAECSAGDRFVWAHPAYWSQFLLVGSGR